ncbi:MAG: exodeoxyribonuclease VII large subunit [Acidimicrobiaceae bacterium]|nr:exodeoxyribonuclease VII large subunit [Acidimicrobiaceae bacterium]MDE0676678.1 exodeoxyribonuclease VII large subunit [Acidimicrobiaceae bacterium]
MSSAVEGTRAAAGDPAGQPDGTWSVSDLTAAVGETIQRAFPGEVWVRGEIIGYSVAASGHIYFNLIEPGSVNDRRGARMRVALFKGRQRLVNRDLAAAGGLTLDDGIEVRIRAEVEYYTGSGQVQLIMSGVDPHFTLGVLAADRERILAELAESGLLRRNAALPLPLVPLRVGLVTADGSAAHADFVDELRASGYAFEVLLCDARVQGVTAEADLVAALRTLGRAEVDVIAVVRGGGDRTDLLAFDLASVAKAIALCPLPVFCGIGHEIDTSVADQAAHTAAKTPTACAAALVAHVAAFDERLATARSVLRLLAERRLARPRAWLGEARLRLGHHTQRHCRTAAGKLASARRSLQRSHAHVQRGTVSLRALRPRLERASARRLGTAKAQLRSASALVSAVAPERTLARGFSITRAADGSIVRDMPATGDTIVTETARARFASTVSAEASAPPGKPTTETADLRD